MQGNDPQILLDDDKFDENEEVKVEAVHPVNPVIQPHQSDDAPMNQIDRTVAAA